MRTANTNNANIWVEWVAARLGVAYYARRGRLRTDPRALSRPLRAAWPQTCSGYAQGGARVTDPNGIGKTSGALTIPIVQQIASHNTVPWPALAPALAAVTSSSSYRRQ